MEEGKKLQPSTVYKKKVDSEDEMVLHLCGFCPDFGAKKKELMW